MASLIYYIGRLCMLTTLQCFNLMWFTSKKMPINILKYVYKNYSYLYSMIPKTILFFAYDYHKYYAEFYTDFKSVEIIGKKCTHLHVSRIEEEGRPFCTLILFTSGFWPRVRARALRAPVFLGSLTRKKGHCAPPPHAHRSFAAPPKI